MHASLARYSLVEPAHRTRLSCLSLESVGVFDEVGGGQQSDGDAAPQTVGEVDGNRVDDVVDTKFDEQLARSEVDGSGDEADERRTAGVDDRASRGDCDEAGEGSVHRARQVENGDTFLLIEEVVQEEGGHAAAGGGNRRGGGAETGCKEGGESESD